MNSIRLGLIIATLIYFNPMPLFAGPEPLGRRNVLVTVSTGLRAIPRAEEKGVFDVVNSGTRRIKLSVRNGCITGVCLSVVVKRGDKIIHSFGGLQGGDLSEFHDVVGGSEFTEADRENIYYTLSIFETDIPPGHLWQPDSSAAYKVLWSRKFRTASK